MIALVRHTNINTWLYVLRELNKNSNLQEEEKWCMSLCTWSEAHKYARNQHGSSVIYPVKKTNTLIFFH